LQEKASGIILFHNHPSDNVSPSKSDITLTRKLNEGGELLEINIIDHIIIGQNTYFSFADEQML
jgi:DNA repair protein RadC